MTGVDGGVDGSDPDFQAFMVLNQLSLLRLALLLAGDRATAEDLAQTALVRTYAAWGRVSRGDPAAYSRRIVINGSHDRWRRTGRRERLTAVVPEPGSHPDHATATLDRDAILRALAELTVKERRVLVLRYFLELTETETATELGVAVGTVKSTAHRGLQKLRTSPHLVDLPLEIP